MTLVDGVPVHVVAEGRGRPLVILHGNGATVDDFGSSPLLPLLTRHFRVHRIDRPGFGHSPRPAGRDWSPEAQGQLFLHLMRKLGLVRPIVLGHSWGTLPALAMALEAPQAVGALVLVSGFYFPSGTRERALQTPPIPVAGDILRATVTPLLARALWPAFVEKVFAPNAETPGFRAGFPREVALRPSQLRAVADDTRAMVPAARRLAGRLGDLAVPLVVVAGEEDRILDSRRHSVRLAAAVPGSRLHRVPGVGHMVHHVAPERVLAAVEEAARLAGP